MKSKSLILLVLSIGFGIVAAIGISQVMKGQVVAGPSETPRGPVLLAAADLSANEKLTEENVKLENWVVDTIPPDAVTSLDEITDMLTRTRMYPGMPIVRTAIQHKNNRNVTPIPKDMKVVAVRVSADDTIGNLLTPGHRVDVIGVFKKRDQTTNQTSTSSRTFLKALEVYSIGNKTTADSPDQQPSGNSNASSIVGLLVTEKQSEALVFVQDTGSIKLVLRGDDVENDGEVGQLEDLKDELLAGSLDDEPVVQERNLSSVMEIFLGSESRTTEFDNSGSRIRNESSRDYDGNEGEPVSGYDGSDDDESRRDDYADSRGHGDSDRGIDDDQYRGQ